MLNRWYYIGIIAVASCSGGSRIGETGQALGVGAYNFGTLVSPGKCLDVNGSGSANGTKIQEWTCNGTGAQSIRVDDLGNGVSRLVNTNSNKCIDVSAAGTADGTKIQLWDCNGTGAQSYWIQDIGGGNVQIVNTNSNKCVDVQAAQSADGTQVQLWTCNGTNAQQWRPALLGSTPPPPPPPGGKLFVGYFQSWSDSWASTGAATGLANLPSYVNVVNIAFMEPNSSYQAGSLSLGGTGLSFSYDGPTLRDAVSALHQRNPGTKVLVSVGGATYTGWSSFNPGAVAAFVNDFGFDGVDIDYEPTNPNCSSNGSTVQCTSDGEYVSVVNAMRNALARPRWVTIAAWSVGAYGEGTWASAPPQGSAYMGIALAVLKNASGALDLVNVMSYDASSAYSPEQALQAYQNYYHGKIAMGIEVPPEAWGGHIESIGEIDQLAGAVNSSGAAGLMLWSLQKPGTNQQFATEICNQLGLGNCQTAL
jgi:chitinase